MIKESTQARKTNTKNQRKHAQILQKERQKDRNTFHKVSETSPFHKKGTKVMKFEKAWRLLQFAICNLQFSNNKFILSLSSTMISDMSE